MERCPSNRLGVASRVTADSYINQALSQASFPNDVKSGAFPAAEAPALGWGTLFPLFEEQEGLVGLLQGEGPLLHRPCPPQHHGIHTSLSSKPIFSGIPHYDTSSKKVQWSSSFNSFLISATSFRLFLIICPNIFCGTTRPLESPIRFSDAFFKCSRLARNRGICVWSRS